MQNQIQITERIEVNCSREASYAFHADVTNLAKVLPFFMSVKFEKLTWPVEAGCEAIIQFKFFGFIKLFEWHLKFTSFDKPNCFVDEEVGGIFKTFSHLHKFEVSPNNPASSFIEDTVTCSLWNSFLDSVVLKPILRIMLKQKLQQTKQVLEKEGAYKLSIKGQNSDS
jgi:ligand-binding SRPBCC domain-containing protein